MLGRFVRGNVFCILQFLKRREPPLMPIYGEFETVAYAFDDFSINRDSVTSWPYALEDFCFPYRMNEVCRRWMLDVWLPSLRIFLCFWTGLPEFLRVGVVFFSSLPFMGVMLFPSS